MDKKLIAGTIALTAAIGGGLLFLLSGEDKKEAPEDVKPPEAANNPEPEPKQDKPDEHGE